MAQGRMLEELTNTLVMLVVGRVRIDLFIHFYCLVLYCYFTFFFKTAL